MTEHDLPTRPTSSAAGLTSTELEDELLAASKAHHYSKHRLLHLLVEYDQRAGWIAHGATSCAVWWAEVAGIEISTAREQLRVARSLVDFPAFDLAMGDRRLSYAKIRVLSRVADADSVEELIGLGESCPAGRLGVALAAWQAENNTPAAIAKAHQAARSLSFRTEPDGMVAANIRLPPLAGAQVQAMVETQIMRSSNSSGATLKQLRADALLEVLSSRQGPGNGAATESPGFSAEVVVHVHADRSGAIVATLADGTPVPEPELSMVLCGSSIRALVHDSAGQPIDASPARRQPTKRQMRLLVARDKHCQADGCRATSFLQAHHIRPRAHGGPTTLVNLELLCGFHHRLHHLSETKLSEPRTDQAKKPRAKMRATRRRVA